jgi:tRNA A22 N-methylase
MTAPALSERLSALLAAVRPGAPVWDLGCDHGRLGLNAVADGRASHAFCVDRSPAAIASLQSILDAHVAPALLPRLTLLCADAARLEPRPVEGTVVIAGMGAGAMVRILDGFVVPNASPPLRLVLQPAVQPTRVAAWVAASAFTLREQATVVDRQREHPLFIAERV